MQNKKIDMFSEICGKKHSMSSLVSDGLPYIPFFTLDMIENDYTLLFETFAELIYSFTLKNH